MALSPDDRLLGEKTHYYCSSSEDEGEEEDETKYGDEKGKEEAKPSDIPAPELTDYKGYSTNVSSLLKFSQQFCNVDNRLCVFYFCFNTDWP